MTCNVGKTDRILRILVGLLIILAGIFSKSWLGLIGLVPLATAVFRFCPLYPIFGISTDKEGTAAKS